MPERIRDNLAIATAWGLFALAISLVFFYAPTEKVMGVIQKIFYVHLGSALAAALSFSTAFIAGIAYLVKRQRRWDRLGAASIEIGMVFTTLVLITGSLWGRPVWNTWWTWDPRLTTSLILWFIYGAYLILRAAVPQPDKRATYCAVMAIIGFIDVPVVFLSARLWRTIHPVVIRAGSIDMAPAMIVALVASLAAFSLLWLILLRQRVKALELDERLFSLEQRLDGDMP